MTRKAHNVDRERTDAACFRDHQSYWTNAGHVYLFGRDASIVRSEVAHFADFTCNSCGRYADFGNGELDHVKGGNTDDRCWCRHNLQWLCFACHRKKHPQVKLRKVEI